MSNLINSIRNFFGSLFFRIPLSEKIIFAKHLSMMVKAGMSEVDSARLIRKQVQNRRFGSILDKMILDLEGGQFISASLKHFRFYFGDFFINLIEIGEVSGTLSENLDYLASELKKSHDLRGKIRAAMIYPVVIFAATMSITGVLVFFVIPKILPVFYSLRIQLPLQTRILIASADFLLNYYYFVLIGVVAIILVFLALIRIPVIRFFYHRFLLALPFVGKIVIHYEMTNITRILALLLKSGVRIVEGVLITADAIPNDVYKRSLQSAAETIKKGEPLYKYFEEYPKFFPPTVSRMVEVGETTGNLESNLLYLADFYENEVNESTKNLSGILEPVLLLLMGGLVGFVVISIITPIYEVSQHLTR